MKRRETSTPKDASGNVVTRELTVRNELGLHARPATEFVNQVRLFRSEMHLVLADGSRHRADRIFEVLLADLSCGTRFTLEARGIDAQAAVDRIEQLMTRLE